MDPPHIHGHNIFADYVVNDTENLTKRKQLFPRNNQTNRKPKHQAIAHTRQYPPRQTDRGLSYPDRFYVKYVSQKLKIMFQDLTDYKHFLEVCKKQNIQYPLTSSISLLFKKVSRYVCGSCADIRA